MSTLTTRKITVTGRAISEYLCDSKHKASAAWLSATAEPADTYTVAKNIAAILGDNRLGLFLDRFTKKGWFSVEFGFFYPEFAFDPAFGEPDVTNIENYYNLIIKNGIVLNAEEIPHILGILDDAGIVDPLPVFIGRELDYYTLARDGRTWVKARKGAEKGYFYVSYYSVE